MTFNLFMVKQKVQMWYKNMTFPQLNVVHRTVHSRLLDDSINYQKNLNDVSSSAMSKTIPLGTIKTVVVLSSYYVGRELEAQFN